MAASMAIRPRDAVENNNRQLATLKILRQKSSLHVQWSANAGVWNQASHKWLVPYKM